MLGSDPVPARRVLVVEDERSIRELVAQQLRRAGYECRAVASGAEGLELLLEEPFDVVVLDLMLPGVDGITLCRAIREQGINRHVPILILTARRTETDKVLGLESGADDYVTKPFGVLELLARIEALLRRTTGTARAPAAASAERFGDVEVDRAARTVTRDGIPVYLAPMEFELLLALLQRRGAVVSRQELMREVWGHSAVVVSRTVDTHIAELRRKLEHDPAEPRHILTVRKAGYRLER